MNEEQGVSSNSSLIIPHSSLLLPRLFELVADVDAVVRDDEESARVVERETRRAVGEDVAVLPKLVADFFRGLARLVDGEDAPARALGQLLYDLIRLEHVAAERAARAVGNL